MISEWADQLWSHDIDERIEELEAIAAEAAVAIGADPDATHGEPPVLTPADEQELEELRALRNECMDYTSDWNYGITLIRGSYFHIHAREQAEALGVQLDSWPMTSIDWDAAAAELQRDYIPVDFRDVTYWFLGY